MAKVYVVPASKTSLNESASNHRLIINSRRPENPFLLLAFFLINFFSYQHVSVLSQHATFLVSHIHIPYVPILPTYYPYVCLGSLHSIKSRHFHLCRLVSMTDQQVIRYVPTCSTCSSARTRTYYVHTRMYVYVCRFLSRKNLLKL